MENLEHDKASATEDIAFMAEYKGAAMCESLALCYWAGKSFEIDIFNTGQKIITGGLSEKKLTDLLDAHYFAIIQMDDQCACGSQRFPENINQQILANYEAKRSSQKSGVFFLPKEK